LQLKDRTDRQVGFLLLSVIPIDRERSSGLWLAISIDIHILVALTEAIVRFNSYCPRYKGISPPPHTTWHGEKHVLPESGEEIGKQRHKVQERVWGFDLSDTPPRYSPHSIFVYNLTEQE